MKSSELRRQIKKTEQEISHNQHVYSHSKAEISRKLSNSEKTHWFLFPLAGLVLGLCFSERKFFKKIIWSLGKIHILEWLEQGVKHLVTRQYKS